MSVRQTIVDALGGDRAVRGYGAQLDTVVRALEARDATIADQIRTEATRLGATREDVERGLVAVGLVAEAAPILPVTGAAGVDVGAVLTRIEARLGALETAAQRAGVRV